GAEANFREHSADSILQAEEGQDSVAGSKERKQQREKAAHFFVALCSNRPLDPARPLLYLPSTGNVLREREIHIHLLTDHLTQARAAAEQAREHVEQVTAQMVHFQQQEQKLEQLLEERTQWARGLEQQMEERTQWALSLQQEIEQARAALQKLQQEFEERTAWALNLKEELKQHREELQLLYCSLWYRIGKNLRLSPVPASDQKPPQAVNPDDS
ncbi:MAG: hypothetical protein O7A06_01110, partial [Acidobacteria bacterium]|nr:hypothetical protein [Acidobacteriota bacterium]